MLKSCGPRMDPFGTTESRIWNIMLTLLMFTDCFRCFRYEYKRVSKSSLKPWASILAISKSSNHQVCNQKLLLNP